MEGDHGWKGEVDHVVKEVHSRGYIFADDKTLGPDPGWCYNSRKWVMWVRMKTLG